MSRVTAYPALAIWKMLVPVLLVLQPAPLAAHCDTLDGPVVAAARRAIETGDATPVLIWVRVEDEPAVRSVFAETLRVRALGPEAAALADRYFFETLVRLHRAGEGAPYTGLQPAGQVEPVVAEADLALEQGSVERLARALAEEVERGVRARYAEAASARQHREEGVEAGRRFVRAYVEFVHYAEAIDSAAAGAGAHASPAADPQAAREHSD